MWAHITYSVALDSSFGTSVLGTTLIVLMLSMLTSFLNLGYKAAHLELMKDKLQEGKRLKQVLTYLLQY